MKHRISELQAELVDCKVHTSCRMYNLNQNWTAFCGHCRSISECIEDAVTFWSVNSIPNDKF